MLVRAYPVRWLLYGRRFALFSPADYEGSLFALCERRAVRMYVTWSEVLDLLTLVVAIISLVINITKKK